MANFNPKDYETVAERIARFYKDNPDGRIVTENETTDQDRQVSTWVVKAFIFLTSADQAKNLFKATGYAFEIDGQGMANKTSALENAETSAIGRALANAGYSGDKRTTREEMEKVQRGLEVNWYARASLVMGDKTALRALWTEAKAANAPKSILDAIQNMANANA
jgi:hypothetical protein